MMPRRDFLKRGAALGSVLALPTLIPASAFGAGGAIRPSERIVVGFVGMGWMGMSNMESFLGKADAQVVAVCDVDKNHLEEACAAVNRKYGNQSCATYHNFEDMYARGDLDAVVLSLPDHWHAIPAIAAARIGMDVYGEKPFAHSLREGRAMVQALERHGRIWQTGSWQRSGAHFRRACELVRNGRIGKVARAEVSLHGGYDDYEGNADQTAPVDPPETLDYERWLGPAPWSPYAPPRLHKNWRWVMDTGGGRLMDWIGHMLDICHWGLDLDHTGPTEIVPVSSEYATRGVWDAPTGYRCLCRYADGIEIEVNSKIFNVTWYGERGWVRVSREGLWAEPASILNEVIGTDEIQLYRSDDHTQNFLDCIRSRRPTITPAETGHRSASVGQLCNLALQTGRTIRWDPGTEQVIGDPEAARLIEPVYRGPWSL